MEERILEAVEYITISLDDIKDYQDFMKYKPELIKAINDIKNIIQRKIKINENETIENGEGEKSKISSISLIFDFIFSKYFFASKPSKIKIFKILSSNFASYISLFFVSSGKNIIKDL